MKFLILAPFLLAPVFSQLGVISDVANTIQTTAEEGIKTVEDAAVDGSHSVENFGKDVIQTAGNAFNEIETVGQDLAKSIEGVFNPPPQPQQKKDEFASSEVSQQESSSGPSEIKPIEIDGERIPGHQGRRDGKNGHKKSHKSEAEFGLKTSGEMKKMHQQIKNQIEQFKALKEEAEKEGKQISQETIKQHKETIRSLHFRMKQLKEAQRQQLLQNHGENQETVEQSFTMEERPSHGKKMSEEEREKMKEEIKKRVEQKMKERQSEMIQKELIRQKRQGGPQQRQRQQMGQMGGKSSQNGPSERKGPNPQNLQKGQKGEQMRQQGQEHRQKGEQMRQQGQEHRQKGEQMRQQGQEHRQKGEQMRQQGQEHRQKGEQMRQQRQEHKNNHSRKTTQDASNQKQKKMENIRKEEQFGGKLINFESVEDSFQENEDLEMQFSELVALEEMANEAEEDDEEYYEEDYYEEEQRFGPQERLILFN